MIYTRKCKVCSKKFETNRCNVVSCSKKCKKFRNLQLIAEWKKDNLDKHNQHTKNYYQKNSEYLIKKQREWQKDNPDKVKQYNKNYRGKKFIDFFDSIQSIL